MKLYKILIVVLALGMTTDIFAQRWGDFPPGDPPGDHPMREQMRQRIETLKVWKLTEDLNLTPEQSEKFFPAYKQFNDSRKAIEEERRTVFDQLDLLTGEDKPDDKKINELLDKLDNFDQRINDLRVKFRQDLNGILTTQQIGRLYVFEVEFMRHIQDIMRDARKEMRGKGFQGGNNQ